TARIIPGDPSLNYGMKVARAVCVKLPNGQPFPPTGDNQGDPRIFTFDVTNKGSGMYAVRVDCTASSFTKVLSVPSQGASPAFRFRHTERNPQNNIPHGVLRGVSLPGPRGRGRSVRRRARN